MSEGEPAQILECAWNGYFDRFAQRCAEFVSKKPFFTFCVALVLVWAPTFLFMDFDTWQLLINTPTTMITFLLVALLQNTQRRGEQAINKKLDAIADSIADLMNHFAEDNNEICCEIEDSRRRLASKRRCERPEYREGPWLDRCIDHRHEQPAPSG